MRALLKPRPSMVIFALALLTSCSGASQNREAVGGNGSCALTAHLDGRRYLGSGGFVVIPNYGGPIGTATIPPCDDGDGSRIEAVSIVGVSPEVAFASPDFEDIIFIAEGTDPLPSELETLRQEPRCADGDAPIELNGRWLGIIGADGHTEVDMVPPYDLSMRVDDASVARYERTFLTIHVAADIGHPLTRQDLQSSLWEGGDLSVTAACLDGQFWAEVVTASAPS